MKKFVLSLIVVASIIVLAGCGSKEEGNNSTTDKGNTIVVYFSATGTTKKVAQRIASLSNSDIIEIVPKEKYKSEDLTYDSNSRANIEQKDKSVRPAIDNNIDISVYDTIYLGYPIWFGYAPKIIFTFIDTHDFTGKTVIPFCTSGNTDIGNSVKALRSNYSDLNLKDGKRFTADDSDKEIEEFLKKY